MRKRSQTHGGHGWHLALNPGVPTRHPLAYWRITQLPSPGRVMIYGQCKFTCQLQLHKDRYEYKIPICISPSIFRACASDSNFVSRRADVSLLADHLRSAISRPPDADGWSKCVLLQWKQTLNKELFQLFNSVSYFINYKTKLHVFTSLML